MSKKNFLLLVYHFILLSINLFMLYWNCVQDPSLYFLQNFCYLTILTHTLLCFYFILIVYLDFKILGKTIKKGIESRYPEYIHNLFQTVQGLGSVVVLAYWGLRIFKTDLLFPEGYNTVPELLASYSHGGNYLFFSLELFFYEQKVCLSRLEKLKRFSGIIFIYMLIQLMHRRVYGYHIYPFLEKMNYVELGVFYFSLYMICNSWDIFLCSFLVKKKQEKIN